MNRISKASYLPLEQRQRGEETSADDCSRRQRNDEGRMKSKLRAKVLVQPELIEKWRFTGRRK